MCQFCLEKLSSFCMTEFVIANSTTLPKGRAWNSPLHFSCEHGHLAEHTALKVCVPELRALPSCLERPGTWEALEKESWAAACSWTWMPSWACREKRKRKGSQSHFCWPHPLPCMASTFLDPFLFPFTYQNSKTWHCFSSERSLVHA